MLIVSETLQNIAEEETHANSFYKATITMMPKPSKDNTKRKKLQAYITDENRCKNYQQKSNKQNSTAYYKAHTP